MATPIDNDYELAACISCGGSHTTPLMRLNNGAGHYVTCPETREPVFVAHTESAAPPAPQPEAVEPTFPESADEEPADESDGDVAEEEPAVADAPDDEGSDQIDIDTDAAPDNEEPSEEVAPV